jgi:hypothetical protein
MLLYVLSCYGCDHDQFPNNLEEIPDMHNQEILQKK